MNVPLPRGTGPSEFLEHFKRVLDFVERFAPDLILISAGFDAHKDDLFRFFKLTDKTYKVMTELVMDLAERCCAGRVVSVLEGGYHVPTLVKCCTIHTKALATHGQPLPVSGSPVRRAPAPSLPRNLPSTRKRTRKPPPSFFD